MMLIQSICIALRGLGSPNRVERVIRDRAAMLLREKRGAHCKLVKQANSQCTQGMLVYNILQTSHDRKS